jgi:hypothetical protein
MTPLSTVEKAPNSLALLPLARITARRASASATLMVLFYTGASVVVNYQQPTDLRALEAELAKDPELVAELLPAYAPELNPADGIWRHIKYGRIPNYAPQNLSELRQTVTAELDRLRKRPHLLRGFVRFTKLPVWGEPDLARTEGSFAKSKATAH